MREHVSEPRALHYASWCAVTLPNGRVFYQGVERLCPDSDDHAERQNAGMTRHDDPITFSCGHRHKVTRTALRCIVEMTGLWPPAIKVKRLTPLDVAESKTR